MKRPSAKEKTRVLILSSHPVVLPEWRLLVAKSGSEVNTRQVEITPKTDLHELSVPAASIYVIDAHGADWATEALITTVRLNDPEARIIVVGPQFNEVNSFPLIYLRVKGLLRYSEVRNQLLRAVQVVAGGGLWVPRTLMRKFLESLLESSHASIQAPRSHALSRREKEILDCLLKNKSNKEIANELHISESTVKFHVSNILAKFGVQRRTDLILSCFQKAV